MEEILLLFENIMGTLFTQARRSLGMFKTQDDESTGAKSSANIAPWTLLGFSLPAQPRHTADTLIKEATSLGAVVMGMISHDSGKLSEHYSQRRS